MIELFSDVTFSAELLAGGVALPNETDVKVLSELPLLFSDVPSVVVPWNRLHCQEDWGLHQHQSIRRTSQYKLVVGYYASLHCLVGLEEKIAMLIYQ